MFKLTFWDITHDDLVIALDDDDNKSSLLKNSELRAIFNELVKRKVESVTLDVEPSRTTLFFNESFTLTELNDYESFIEKLCSRLTIDF